MCLIAFAWQCHPRWRLLLAGNRDEFHPRPAAALSRWQDSPVIAGRDLEAGATWLGVTDERRCAAVTNVRDPDAALHGASRGLLVTDFLDDVQKTDVHATELAPRAGGYRPFNLLLFDATRGAYVGNRAQRQRQRIAPGVHGLSNASLDTPWPKVRVLTARLEAWMTQGDAEDFAPLFDALADTACGADSELPDTGVGLELERTLSAAFIRGDTYGTRASTVVAVGEDGCGWIVERRFGPNGRPDGQTRIAIGG